MNKMIEVEAKCCENQCCVDCEGTNKVMVMIDPDQLRKLGWIKRSEALENVVIDEAKVWHIFDRTPEGSVVSEIIKANPIKLKESGVGK